MPSKELRKTLLILLMLPIFGAAVATANVFIPQDVPDFGSVESDDFETDTESKEDKSEESKAPFSAANPVDPPKANNAQPNAVEPSPKAKSALPKTARAQEDDEPKVRVVEDVEKGNWFAPDVEGNDDFDDSEIRPPFVMADEDGLINGRVRTLSGSAAARMKLEFLYSGRSIGETRTDSEGRFQIKLSKGVYSVIGYKPGEQLVAFGFMVIKYDPNRSELANAPQMDLIAMNGPFNDVESVIRTAAPKIRFRSIRDFPDGEGKDDPSEAFGLEGLSKIAPKTAPAPALEAAKIELNSKGEFVGRIHQIHGATGRPVRVVNTTLLLYQNGQRVDSVKLDEYGVFRVKVSPGNYGAVLAGEDGFGAMGIQLVAASTVDALPIDESEEDSKEESDENPGLSPPDDAAKTDESKEPEVDTSGARFIFTSFVKNSPKKSRLKAGGFSMALCQPDAAGFLNLFGQEMNDPQGGALSFAPVGEPPLPPIPSIPSAGGAFAETLSAIQSGPIGQVAGASINPGALLVGGITAAAVVAVEDNEGNALLASPFNP